MAIIIYPDRVPLPQLVVNINTADERVLQRVPGIGPALAKLILERRQKKGLFTFKEDLMELAGVGEKSFHRMKHLLAVSGPTTLWHKKLAYDVYEIGQPILDPTHLRLLTNLKQSTKLG